MAKYNDGDIVTYYFIINDDGRNSMIQGWTDNKALAKFYMDFHKCKRFHMKTLTKSIDDISHILDENNNDEIQIRNITIRNAKKPNRTEYVSVPMTDTEYMYVNEECKSLMSSMVNYSFIDTAIPYLKGKYKQALNMIMLQDAINVTVHGRRSSIIESVEFDQMMVLLYSFPSNFG